MAFWYFLSTRFGKTVTELKATMPYSEFVHQVAFYRLHPWGDDWQQAGTMAWASAAPHIKRRMKPADFMPGKVRDSGPAFMFEEMKRIATSGK